MTTTSSPYELLQLGGGVSRGAGHAAEPRVAAQKVLQRDRAEDAPVRPPREALLGLERRLQAVGPVAIGDDAAR